MIGIRAKICGMTNAADAALAAELGAWAIGFIFFPSSARCVSVEKAGEIIRSLQAPSLRKFGVFVDESLAEIGAAVSRSRIDTVQLHGSETPEFMAELRALLPETKIVKVLRPRVTEDLRAIAEARSAHAILVDHYAPDVFGGSGVVGDWRLARLARLAAGPREFLLAGGIRAENVGAAVRETGASIVDLVSGVEASPGRKSPEKMREFFVALRAVEEG